MKYSYEELETIIDRIEDEMSNKLLDQISGYFVYVNILSFDAEDMQETSINDIRDVCAGGLKIACLIRDNSGTMLNDMIFKVREFRNGETRGKLRFVPKGSFAVDWFLLTPSNHGDSSYVRTFYLLQKENLFVQLLYDKRFAVHPARLSHEIEAVVDNAMRRITSSCFENKNSFCVTYEYKNILFAFPINPDELKETFRKREKENGRRRTLPTVIKEHSRNGVIIPKHLRIGQRQIRINGRTFNFLFGTDFCENVFSNQNGRKRIRKMAQNDELMPIQISMY